MFRRIWIYFWRDGSKLPKNRNMATRGSLIKMFIVLKARNLIFSEIFRLPILQQIHKMRESTIRQFGMGKLIFSVVDEYFGDRLTRKVIYFLDNLRSHPIKILQCITSFRIQTCVQDTTHHPVRI